MVSLLSILRSESRSWVCTDCFIFKIGRIIYVVPAADFLADSICSVQEIRHRVSLLKRSTAQLVKLQALYRMAATSRICISQWQCERQSLNIKEYQSTLIRQSLSVESTEFHSAGGAAELAQGLTETTVIDQRQSTREKICRLCIKSTQTKPDVGGRNSLFKTWSGKSSKMITQQTF